MLNYNSMLQYRIVEKVTRNGRWYQGQVRRFGIWWSTGYGHWYNHTRQGQKPGREAARDDNREHARCHAIVPTRTIHTGEDVC